MVRLYRHHALADIIRCARYVDTAYESSRGLTWHTGCSACRSSQRDSDGLRLAHSILRIVFCGTMDFGVRSGIPAYTTSRPLQPRHHNLSNDLASSVNMLIRWAIPRGTFVNIGVASSVWKCYRCLYQVARCAAFRESGDLDLPHGVFLLHLAKLLT